MDALYAPRRTVLDPILVTAAREAGVEVRYGVTVAQLRHDRGRVVGVDTIDRRRRATPMTARLVVGADGRHSTIARLVQAPCTHAATSTSASVYAYMAGLDADGYHWVLGTGLGAGR